MNAARWRQLESLDNQALEMEETRRSAFLHEACGGDEDLQHDLEELFAEESQAASFLEKAALREIARVRCNSGAGLAALAIPSIPSIP